MHSDLGLDPFADHEVLYDTVSNCARRKISDFLGPHASVDAIIKRNARGSIFLSFGI